MLEHTPIRHSVWCAVRNEKGKFLLLKRSRTSNNGGQWNLPGGGIELNEDTLKAGAREFQEECGVTVNNWQRLFTVSNKDRIMNFIRPINDLTNLKIHINSESSKYDWVSLKNLNDYNLHFPTRQFFKVLKEKEHLQYRQRLVQGQLFLDVTAERNGEIIAKSKICLPSRKLHNVYVEPFYRGLGYGDDLMSHIMSLPNHPIQLTANSEKGSLLTNKDLVKFYNKFGFVATDVMANTQFNGPVFMKLQR